MEFYNKHYIRMDTQGKIVYGFSDAFHQANEGDICINKQGGYQFRLFSDGEENPPLTNMLGCHLWRYRNGQVQASTAEEMAEEETEVSAAMTEITQIAGLKAQLTTTDYKVVKCSECQLAGEPLPYDIAALHTERQALRDQINELETTPYE